MNDNITQMIHEAESISAEMENLLDQPTQENLLKANDLNIRFKSLSDSIESYSRLEKDAVSAKQFLTQPVQNVPFDSGVRTSGVKASGYSTIESTRSKSTLYNEGEGLLSDRTWQSISEPEYKRAFMAYLRKGEKGMERTELKALQEGVDASGGFFVPEDFIERLIQRSPTPTTVQDRVTRLTTGRDAVVLPRVNYTADDLYTTGIRATYSGEVPANATSIRVTEPTFGQSRIPIYTAMLSMPLTNNMVEDANFPIQSWAEQKFSETIRLLKENAILNGSGIGMPTGILSDPGGAGQPEIVTMGNPLTGDGIVKMAWSVPEQYDSNLSWVFNKTSTGAYIADLKDTNGRFLWGAGLQDSGLSPNDGGTPYHRRLLQGYPVTFQGFMPNLGSGSNPVIFGDLRGYYLVERIGFSIQVLRELYAETNQILLLGRVRFGGQVCEEYRLKVGQQA